MGSRRALREMAFVAVALIALMAQPCLVHAQGTEMFPTKGTSDKPQSKLWHNDGSWWTVLNNTSKLAIYRLESGAWVHKLDIQNAVTPTLKGGTNDVLWDGTHLFIAVYDVVSSKIYKLSYNSMTQSHALLAGFPVSIAMRLGSETIVIDKDSTGRLWATYEAENRVQVIYTTTADHKTWVSTPYNPSATIEADDISTIVAFGGHFIGVAWTDQRTHQVVFRRHRDTDPPTNWGPTEVVRSGFGVIDDHINMKADSQGRVYIAAKDYFDAVYIARRDPAGTWTVTTGASGLDCGTRPILQIDEASNKLYVFYTRWAQCVSDGAHKIESRVAYLDNLLFSLPTVMIGQSGVTMNEVQGTKQLLPDSSLAIICEGSNGKAYWTGWGPISGIGGSDPGGQFPPPPAAPINLSGATITEDPQSSALLWRFDEGSGLTANDASGNNRKGTLGTGFYQPHYFPGIVNTGLYFDGDDYVSASNAGLIFTNASFTLESWIKLDLSNTVSTGMIFARGDTAHVNYELSVYGNQIEFAWSYDDTTDASVKATGALMDGAWHHVAAVYDHAAAQGRIYIDGARKAAKTVLPPTYGNSSWTVYAGAVVFDFQVDKTFTGTMDLACITSGAKYNSDFTPPLLFPSSTTNYARLDWDPVGSIAGIAGYRISRSQNSQATVVLNSTLTTNTWFPDFAPTDGFLNYCVKAVDGLTQSGFESCAALAYESNPPMTPSAPLSLAWTAGTATAEGPAHWSFDEGVGADSEDGTDLGHQAQLGSAVDGDNAEPGWIWGRSGKGLHFDGSDDYVEIADRNDLRFASSYTVELWVRREKLNAQQCLLTKDGGSSKRNYSIAFLSNNKIEFAWNRSSGSSRKTTSTAEVIDTDWHHIACVYDGAQAKNFIFLDGVQVGTSDVSGTPYTGSEPIQLGIRQGSDKFKGDLDLVRISNVIRYTGTFTPPGTYLGSPKKHIVNLSWGMPTAGLVKEYNVYRQLLPSGSTTQIGTVPWDAPSLTDVNVSAAAIYRYTVKATNSDNNAGPASAPLDVTVPQPTDVEEIAPTVRGPRLRLEPNPFNPQSMVRFQVEARGMVQLVLFDARGRRVTTVVEGVLDAGEHRIPLLQTHSGARLASGVYFLRMLADGRDVRVKAVLLK